MIIYGYEINKRISNKNKYLYIKSIFIHNILWKFRKKYNFLFFIIYYILIIVLF